MIKLKKTLVVVVLFCSPVNVIAQKAAEIYIPIGESPGLSGGATMMGEIAGIGVQPPTVMLSDSTGSHSITITDETEIWLDRSRLRLSNQTGTFEDLQEGQVVEIMYEHDERDPASVQGPIADWIKIRIE